MLEEGCLFLSIALRIKQRKTNAWNASEAGVEANFNCLLTRTTRRTHDRGNLTQPYLKVRQITDRPESFSSNKEDSCWR
jgi:hypothetical protein